MTTATLPPTGTDMAVDRAEALALPENRGWSMLTLLLLGQLMGLIDVTIVNVAMPAIATDLHASGAALQLVVGGYTVAYAMLLITGARLGDLYGRRRMYWLGVVGFTLASLACGLAPNAVTLVAFRFLQGASAAVMVPQIISVIQMRFQGPARAKALSAYGAVLSIGAVVGLVLGGVLVNADLFGFTWRPVFLVNVPIGAFLTVLVPRLVPADEPRGTRRLDLAGLTIASSAVLLVVLPLVLGHELGWPAWTYFSIAAGLGLAGLFIVVERRLAARGGDPMVNLDVLRVRGLGAGLIALFCLISTYGAFLFIFTLHLQAGLGESALRTGFTYLPMAAIFGFVAFYWRKLPERFHYSLAPVGLTVCGLAYLAVAVASRNGQEPGALLWIGLAALGGGLGFVMSLLTQSLTHVPLTRAADASGMLTTAMQLGQIIGVAIFGTIFFSVLASSPSSSVAQSSASALTTTSYWLLALVAAGLVAAVPLSRAVLRTRQPATSRS